MSAHRLVAPSDIRIISVAPPFSNFNYVDNEFGDVSSIRRLFSQARSYGCRTLVIESIPSVGVIAEDNAELRSMFEDFQCGGLLRVSFWKVPIRDAASLSADQGQDLLGFAILKRDLVPSRKAESWYVFESVIVKYPHEHNCVRGSSPFHVRVGEHEYSVAGVLYCQQDGLNKACAQVALRALLGTRRPDEDISYRQINQWASADVTGFETWRGLDVPQIQRVLAAVGMGYFDIDYSGKTAVELAGLAPYQKLVYAGVESGAGALLGFKLCGPGLTQESKHIVPFFGHTFNKDTWVPYAESAYFHVGEKTKYLPSESWVSSFIGHDDNFGSNFCVPRHYVGTGQAEYVVEIFAEGCTFSGSIAEAVAVDLLYSILPAVHGQNHPWLTRLAYYAHEQVQQVVLRAICVTAEEYVQHWAMMRDWQGNAEDPQLYATVKGFLPQRLWMIEVSVPELFPANLRKVGEILLDATKQPYSANDFRRCLLPRVPGSVLILEDVAANGTPSFVPIPSALKWHTPLFGCEQAHLDA